MKDRVALDNPDAEFALVGSLLAWPAAMTRAGNIDADWFSDASARVFFMAAQKAHQNGGELSLHSVIGNLPDSANDDDPSRLHTLYGALLDRAAGPEAIPGLVAVVRDRWARRRLVSVAKTVQDSAPMFAVDPFALTNEVIVQADRIFSARKQRDAGSIEQGAEELLNDVRENRTVRTATTGFKAVDAKIGGYRAGQLYVLAGRPAMGKSTIGTSSALRTAAAGNGVLFFSLEMTKEEVVARCLSDAADDPAAPTYAWILQRKVSAGQIEALEVVKSSVEALPLYFDYSPSMTFRDIAAEARRVKAEMAERGQRLDVVFVDHLTIIQPADRYHGNPVMEVSQNIDGLRVLAKELDCAVVALCQLSREVEKREDKRPQLSDLRWTGEIEQAAHVVAFVYREEYYLKNDPDVDRYRLAEARNQMDLLIRKNRQGETGDVTLFCDMAHSTVRDPRQ